MSRLSTIALDASALGERHGIGRYLGALLPRMMALAPERRWLLYGRDAQAMRANLPASDRVTFRGDGLSPGAGRVASLFLAQPRWAARDRPDLFWSPAHRLPVTLPAACARVVTIHDLCWREAPATMRTSTRWLDRVLMPRALRMADRIIAVSGATRDAVTRLTPDAESRTRLVHEASEALPSPEASPVSGRYVLCVGTVEPRKNFDRLFRAFAGTPGDVRLVLAGNRGWGTDSPTAMAAAAGIADRFTWLGSVDDATLSSLYRNAAFLAMPSLYEGFGLPILEALSQGTPVLYGDNSSMPEVAGDAGIAVDAQSVDSIAAGLARLLRDDALRELLASRATRQAAGFSWDRAARETLAVFDEAVAARRARQPRSA